ncbi:hypothetical protein EGW08_014684 [Elysia chlorotica]|uniref:Uncharacterized protein n=1 Tax=Elysia chlorotica TaxID=188477 RepID=A0A433T7G8_ELYCH|nr:hypothetical protein EGW08_014684 [Elysia chlorotica]
MGEPGVKEARRGEGCLLTRDDNQRDLSVLTQWAASKWMGGLNPSNCQQDHYSALINLEICGRQNKKLHKTPRANHDDREIEFWLSSVFSMERHVDGIILTKTTKSFHCEIYETAQQWRHRVPRYADPDVRGLVRDVTSVSRGGQSPPLTAHARAPGTGPRFRGDNLSLSAEHVMTVRQPQAHALRAISKGLCEELYGACAAHAPALSVPGLASPATPRQLITAVALVTWAGHGLGQTGQLYSSQYQQFDKPRGPCGTVGTAALVCTLPKGIRFASQHPGKSLALIGQAGRIPGDDPQPRKETVARQLDTRNATN